MTKTTEEIEDDAERQEWTLEDVGKASDHLTNVFETATLDTPLLVPLYASYRLLRLTLARMREVGGSGSALLVLDPIMIELDDIYRQLVEETKEGEARGQEAAN